MERGSCAWGWTLTLAGISQPLEWAEFPLVVAAVIELCLVLLFSVRSALPKMWSF